VVGDQCGGLGQVEPQAAGLPPAGELEVLKPPINFSGMEPRLDAIPALGEHGRKILAELGYGAAEIERLAADRAI